MGFISGKDVIAPDPYFPDIKIQQFKTCPYMIRVYKGEAPEYLHSDVVTEEKKRLQMIAEGQKSQERLHFDPAMLRPVRGSLHKLFSYKCAYCESSTSLTGDGLIDNFRPKAGARGLDSRFSPRHYWWLAYDWDNLLLSCEICSEKYKRDFFPVEDGAERAAVGTTGEELFREKALLIDPCRDQPEQHLLFQSDGTVEALSKKGKVTIEILGLNRTELVQRRQHAAQGFQILLDLAVFQHKRKEPVDPIVYDEIAGLFADMPQEEFVATRRQVFRDWADRYGELWAHIRQIREELSGIEIIRKPVKKKTAKLVDEIRDIDSRISEIKRFSIQRVEIRNFKVIADLSLDIMPPDEALGREPWLLLLGDNGAGKSSILQAITLALCSPQQRKKLKISPKDCLRRGEVEGYVRIHAYERNEPIELRFDARSFSGGVEEPPTYLLAYGSTRLLPKGSLRHVPSAFSFANIDNLFDYSKALTDVNEWLGRIEETAFNERIAPAFFDLLALRSGDQVFFRDKSLYIDQYESDTALREISDGYKSIVALAGDIMKTLSGDEASYHSSQAIVLIDELGNHLHPRWRMKIVEALKKTFPRIQFIVTTHEPLCLRGLVHGEVAVLVRDQQQTIQVLGKELLPDHNLLRVDQLLTSDLFGLLNTMDPEVEKSYEEYYELLSKPREDRSEEDQARIEKYRHELSEKEKLGDNPEVQALYQIVFEKFARPILEEGYKTKESLKNETIAEVKDLLEENKALDWI